MCKVLKHCTLEKYGPENILNFIDIDDWKTQNGYDSYNDEYYEYYGYIDEYTIAAMKIQRFWRILINRDNDGEE